MARSLQKLVRLRGLRSGGGPPGAEANHGDGMAALASEGIDFGVCSGWVWYAIEKDRFACGSHAGPRGWRIRELS